MSSEYSWLDELDFSVGPPWLRMGVSRVPASAWLLPCDPAQQQERVELLETRREAVVFALPEASRAIDELSALVASHLDLDDDAFVWDSLGQIGCTVCEDFCVLLDSGSGLKLVAGLVCFPSHWVLAEKIGRSVSEIHEPVPGYEDELSRRVDTFLTRLGGGVFARRNWSLQWSNALFSPGGRGDRRPMPGSLGLAGIDSGAWLRSERQTFRTLPESGAVVFTIRTQLAPMVEVSRRPDVAGRLEKWIEAAPDHLVEMRCGMA